MDKHLKMKISNVVEQIEKVITNTEDYRTQYNIVTELNVTTEQYLEKVIQYISTPLRNVYFELEHESDDYKVINELLKGLNTSLEDKKETYQITVVDEKGQRDEVENREQFLLGVLEWAFNYIIENIELEEK
ncbi:hypothetical protein [Mammaliicoccus lentus]|uniref:hypothetical protein n=1 Tax=Mammaliicoccus lentus TaxID=42858 RepID=UPI002DB88E40|nr:hypothetical protein [Mammaliicoccus lentus]MEB5686666.1 hypothetical protein [Mammaliicoccus lentus]